MREVLSYSRRGGRFTPGQAAAWEAHATRWVIPEDALERPDFTLGEFFGREAPLVVEIGSGVGEATVALASRRPGYDVLALEVWRPGVADSLVRIAEAGVENVRLCRVDAVWALEHLVPPAGLAELWTFFPDPWPKTRHHKRRLVDAAFARLAAGRLGRGATWRLATDWADYADQMRDVLDAVPELEGGVVPRWEERPLTRFERKGLAAGRAIFDLAYRRRA
jgi:tRNA (guanine-N7-)-methyltransferase